MSALLFPDELTHQLNHSFTDPSVGAREVFTERGHLIPVQERSPKREVAYVKSAPVNQLPDRPRGSPAVAIVPTHDSLQGFCLNATDGHERLIRDDPARVAVSQPTDRTVLAAIVHG